MKTVVYSGRIRKAQAVSFDQANKVAHGEVLRLCSINKEHQISSPLEES
ncbi:MAG: hypothetical protein J7M18_01330 [Candidatus Eremiobacteraeota bacterium]|nr:hypothetical protein [Candidatus Eremiobacteraeota bacterium]